MKRIYEIRKDGEIKMSEYDHQHIETKWQKLWEEAGIFKTSNRSNKKKFYNLVMFPYPSGTLHVGHVKNYVLGDVLARYKRMRGYNVLNPMGYDAFGLPAENAAIENRTHPAKWTYNNINIIKKQLKRLGMSYDWDREVYTCKEDYYKWTQWLFLKLYENGLAYKKKAAANWCPHCKTVLANEQVVNGKCERCGTPVTIIQLDQWFFKITAYAERLLKDLDKLTGWPERVRVMQRNWIGRSEGAEVDFPIKGMGRKIKIFTTRPDTLWGVTFMALAPESPLVEELVTDERRSEVSAFLERIQGEDRFKRTAANGPKEGVFIGRWAINPVNGEEVPIYVANYVLMEYGTGAIMAVPAHDKRDFDFARAYALPIKRVIAPSDGSEDTLPYTAYGTMINSDKFSGLSGKEAIDAVIDYLEERGIGKRNVNYKLRDWLISRQRFWGTPIPIVYCPKCGMVPVPENQLPVRLPEEVEFPETGASPLPNLKEFVQTRCPRCGGPATREVDTMDTFIDSSWYYLRYVNPHLDDKPFDTNDVNAWLPVDQYIGGIEHAVLHLMYSRFITKVLYDLGYVNFDEPFENLFTQGMIYYKGAKMSKSKGNVISPDELIARYGADSVRMYLLFIAPPENDAEWNDSGFEGVHRFIQRIWRLYDEYTPRLKNVVVKDMSLKTLKGDAERRLYIRLNKITKKITDDIERDFHFNTAISGLMELLNEVYDYVQEKNDVSKDFALLKFILQRFVTLIYPFVPHLGEELWALLGNKPFLANEPWPSYDKDALISEEHVIPITINGKVRDRIEVNRSLSEEDIKRMVLDREKIKRWIDGKKLEKIIVIKDKIVNMVVR